MPKLKEKEQQFLKDWFKKREEILKKLTTEVWFLETHTPGKCAECGQEGLYKGGALCYWCNINYYD